MAISPSNAQSLSSHQWKDRVIVISADDTSSQVLKAQISEFEKHQKGLDERRLVIYQSFSNQIKKGFDQESVWLEPDKSFQKIERPESNFEVILIGFDGGVKLRKNEFVSCEELFGVIDQMPMRMSEIKRKKDGKGF